MSAPAPPASRPPLSFWYEHASPYAHLAAQRIGPLAAARGVAVAWRPFLLGAVFKASGLPRSPNLLSPAREAHMWRDAARASARLGLPFARPEPFPPSSIRAARVATALGDDRRPAFSAALFRLTFGEGRPPDDEAALRAALAEAGADADAALTAAAEAPAKDALRAATDEAIALGVFGAPSFVVAGELFWGNDRLEEALDHAAGAA